MTFNIEFDHDDVIRVIFELRRASKGYKKQNRYYLSERCSLLACRVEMQYRAQQECDDQDSQEDPIE